MQYTDEELREFLEHHGVKGMHWGVRKERTPGEQELHDSRVKSIGIAAGAGVGAYVLSVGNPVVAGLVSVGAYHAARHALYPVSSYSSAEKATGKAFVDNAMKHPAKN